MNRTILSMLLGVLFLSLMCGCPRTGDNGNAAGGEVKSTPASSTSTETETATDNPCATEDMPEGEADNPCADPANPCGDNPCADPANPCGDNPCTAAEDATAEDVVTTVVFETTDGDIVMEVHSAWSPLGAEHFLELVRAGYYDGAPWFRVIEGFVAQCGIAADPAMTRKYQSQTINDEPVVMGNKRGFVAFGKSGMPNSRSTHIFINYQDNTGAPAYLDRQGFSCFAQVVEGMEVADGLFKCEFDQGILSSEGGLDSFKQRFPDADFINRAYIRE